jgi:NAD(P)-dependent dehydrogenase (short-subunit alcohol dehydrogenase family)
MADDTSVESAAPLNNVSDSILDRSGAADQAPECVLVAGATGGIGASFCAAIAARFPDARLIRMARAPQNLKPLHDRTIDIQLDIADEQKIRGAVAKIPETSPIDWIFIATGWLHDSGHKPEKTYKSLDAEHLLHAYRINAVGPALLLKHLVGRLDPATSTRIGIVSARVGSISDNRLGGWHAYRASKAALNMLIKNYAIELARKNAAHIVVGLQPGTTDTPLSAPFQRNVPEGQLQTPEYTAEQLLRVMLSLRPEDSGGLYDFLGVPFAP